MKFVGAISTAVLSLSLGVGIPAYAQQEPHEQQDENKDKPAQEKEKKAQPAKPEEKSARPEEKNVKPEEKRAQQPQTQEAKPGNQEQRAGGNSPGRIPDDRFKANFGRDHHFRVSQADYSSRRFQYGGYSFGFVDAWPSNWLYTQDVYVVEIGGVYYLCNASYPGVNLALSITL